MKLQPLLTTSDVAAYLQKSPLWVTQEAPKYGLPRLRLGRQWRYRLDAIDAWLGSVTLS